jgi:23S rRNA (guanosine2251-2'-O)-methyltransferase
MLNENRKEGHRRRRERRHSDMTATIQTLDLDDLLALVDSWDRPGLLLILDGVTDPHTLGACLRTAEAAGVNAVVVPKDRSTLITDTVRQVASGAAERVPFATVTNLARAMKALRAAGVWLVGTADDAEKSIYQVDLTGSVAIVVGAEGTGLRRLTKENCDFLIPIPMAGRAECLNVSVAAGVCLFEAVRQRRG